MIRVNCINLESRTERKNHIEIEFSDRHEFNLRIVQAIKHEVGAIGLWQSLIGVVKEMSLYDDGVLQEGIETAKSHNADILLGGVSWLETAVQVSDRMFWVDKYTGNQFVVIFKKFYPVILGITDFENMTADKKISELSENKFVIFPFISLQKEFGYSDATNNNNNTGRVDYLFDTTIKKLSKIDKVRRYYCNMR